MKRKELKLKVKQELKELAKEIRELKNKRKGARYGYVPGLEWSQEEYREKHVAYCIYFNHTPYELIESNPREPLTRNHYSGHLANWNTELRKDAETVCTSS